MKRLISLMAVFVLIFAGVIFQPNQKVTAATNQTAYVGSSAVKAGNYIYYKKGSETTAGVQLVRQKVGSSSTEKIAYITGDFYVYDGYVYYVSNMGLYKIKVDGTKKTKLDSSIIEVCGLNGNYVYYKKLSSGSYILYRINLTGKDKRALVQLGYIGELAIAKNKIYYTIYSSQKYKLYSSDLDGKNNKLLLGNCKNLTLDGNTLYFVYNNTNSTDGQCIAKLTADNKAKVITKITDAVKGDTTQYKYDVMSLRCIDSNILYYTLNSDADDFSTTLCKVTPDGKATKVASCSVKASNGTVDTNGVGELIVQSGYICVEMDCDSADSQIYIMKTDGSKQKLIADYAGIDNVSMAGQNIYFASYASEESGAVYKSVKYK